MRKWQRRKTWNDYPHLSRNQHVMKYLINVVQASLSSGAPNDQRSNSFHNLDQTHLHKFSLFVISHPVLVMNAGLCDKKASGLFLLKLPCWLEWHLFSWPQRCSPQCGLRGSGGTSKFIFTNGISFNYNPHRFALQFQLIKATLYRLSLAWRSAGLEKSHHWDKRRWNISYPVSALSGKIGLTLSHNLQLDRRQYWDFWEIHTGYLCTNNKDCTVETQADTTHEISRGSRGYGNYPKSTRAPNAFP